MTIVLHCPNCQSKVNAQEEWFGKKVRCKKCQVSFVLASPKKQTLGVAEVLGAIQTRIAPVPSTLGYKLSLLAVSFTMVLLPLIYLGLVIGMAASAVAYGYYGLALFEIDTSRSRKGGAGLLMLYLGPLVAAAVAVVFMFKPFFASSSETNKTRSLDRQSDPLLFAFVDKLCHAVHAPVPKRIDIDTEVNASASFRHGWFSLFQPNDLVLTIGMPLVSGLTVRELGGVLAHEFGHFSQGLGMRLNYVVRSINHWFARVVYERDEWDEWLENTANGMDGRINWVLYFAMAIVWLTRRILWIFMVVGNGLSCLLMRQMEYDADLHEIRFAGSEAFISTAKKLRHLGFAYHQSMDEIQNFFVDGKLVNNLPRLVQMNRDGLGKSEQLEIDKSADEEEAGWFDTHPIDKDRIAVAKKVNDPGIFQLEAPANILFPHFETRCKQASRDFFQAIFEDEFHENMLVDVEHLQSFKESSEEASRACKRFFGPHFLVPRMIHFASPSNRGVSEQSSILQLSEMRQIMIDRLATYDQQSKEFDDVDSKWLLCHQAIALHRMELKLKASDWPDVPVKSLQATWEAAERYRSNLAKLHEQLSQFEIAFSQRVDAAVQWLHSKSHEVKQPTLVLRSLSVLQENYPSMVALRNDMAAITTILHCVEASDFSSEQLAAIKTYTQRITQSITELLQQFLATSYPFEHAKGKIDLATYLVPNAPTTDDIGEVISAAEQLLNNYHTLYFRSIGVLASIVQNVESQLGLAPQNDPVENKTLVTETAPSTSAALQSAQSLAVATPNLTPTFADAEEPVFATVVVASSPSSSPRFGASSWSISSVVMLVAGSVLLLLLGGAMVIAIVLSRTNSTQSNRGLASRATTGLNSPTGKPLNLSFPKANSQMNQAPPGLGGSPQSALPPTNSSPTLGRTNAFNTNTPATPQARQSELTSPTAGNAQENLRKSGKPSLEQLILELGRAGVSPSSWAPMSQLLSEEVDDGKRGEVLVLVRKHLQALDLAPTPNALLVYCRWSDSSCAQELAALLESKGNRAPHETKAVIEALGRLNNSSHIEILTQYLGDIWCQDAAKDTLIRFGEKVEEPALKRLAVSNEMQEQRCIVQLLERCGTSISLVPLQKLLRHDDVFLVGDVQSAIKEIQARSRPR